MTNLTSTVADTCASFLKIAEENFAGARADYEATKDSCDKARETFLACFTNGNYAQRDSLEDAYAREKVKVAYYENQLQYHKGVKAGVELVSRALNRNGHIFCMEESA